MVIFDLILALLPLPVLIWPFLPTNNKPRWLNYLPAAGMVLMAVNLLVETHRLRVIPAYLLTIVVFLFTLPRLIRPATTQPRRRFGPILGSLLALPLLVTAAAFPLLLPFHTVPPSGPYAVGTATYAWTDSTREELYTPAGGDLREVAVQVWYPADGQPGKQDMQDAAVSPAENTYPLVIFSHGGFGLRIQNTSTFRELASRGYIVASIDHTYLSMLTRFPDGRTVMISPLYQQALGLALKGDPAGEAGMNQMYDTRAADMIFTLNQLAALNQSGSGDRLSGKIDLSKVGLFGHSAGASTAGRVCREDSRCTAALMLDGTMRGEVIQVNPDYSYVMTDEPFPAPMMQINSNLFKKAEVGGYEPNKHAFENAVEPAYLLTLNGAEHLNLSDLALILARPALKIFGDMQVALGSIDPVRGVQVMNTYTLAFFDQYLKDIPSPLLQGPSPDYPEMDFTARP